MYNIWEYERAKKSKYWEIIFKDVQIKSEQCILIINNYVLIFLRN